MKTLSARFDVVITNKAAQCMDLDTPITMTTRSKRKRSSKFSHVVMVEDPGQRPEPSSQKKFVLCRGYTGIALRCCKFELILAVVAPHKVSTRVAHGAHSIEQY